MSVDATRSDAINVVNAVIANGRVRRRWCRGCILLRVFVSARITAMTKSTTSTTHKWDIVRVCDTAQGGGGGRRYDDLDTILLLYPPSFFKRGGGVKLYNDDCAFLHVHMTRVCCEVALAISA
mmetsp:Transcript_22181/g.53745  ORF Transcript_22181/g.53745 Transcript_22181/m.53745 type:complete len:123 (-) Transcript_22181:79-447(-)